MPSPHPLYFVYVGFVTLWCAFLGTCITVIIALVDGSLRTPNNPPKYDLGVLMLLGAWTGAMGNIAVTTLRLWRVRRVSRSMN